MPTPVGVGILQAIFQLVHEAYFQLIFSRGGVHQEWNFSFYFQTEALPHFAEVFNFMERLPLQLLRQVGVRVLSLTQIGHTGGSKVSRQP